MQSLPLNPSLEEYFGAAFPKVSQFASLLVDEGIPRGLIGPGEADKIWDRHITNCSGVCGVLPVEGAILDLGSGAGLPGVVIAIMRPTQPVILLESLLRRTNWLTEIATVLELPNITVVRGRAGETLNLPDVVAVTARAVAPLPKLLGWSAPLLESGGALYALKGSAAAEELASISSGADSRRFSRDWQLPGAITEVPTIPGVTPTTVVKVQKK
jgi:16S rRNA (guanine527-N7)-methyltransferase